MVGSGHVVKLGDFGMARAMYDSDYYRFGRKGKTLIYVFIPQQSTAEKPRGEIYHAFGTRLTVRIRSELVRG